MSFTLYLLDFFHKCYDQSCLLSYKSVTKYHSTKSDYGTIMDIYFCNLGVKLQPYSFNGHHFETLYFRATLAELFGLL